MNSCVSGEWRPPAPLSYPTAITHKPAPVGVALSVCVALWARARVSTGYVNVM